MKYTGINGYNCACIWSGFFRRLDKRDYQLLPRYIYIDRKKINTQGLMFARVHRLEWFSERQDKLRLSTAPSILLYTSPVPIL